MHFLVNFIDYMTVPLTTLSDRPAGTGTADDDSWRVAHLGRLLGLAMRRFDERVLQLMSRNVELPLALSNVAARAQVSAAQVHLTRHLDLAGNRPSELAERAGLSKQAMAVIVEQGVAWGLVERAPDARDARACLVRYTATGLQWREAFRLAVAQAEAELRQELGEDVAAVLKLALEAYGAGYSPRLPKLPKIS
jgi:DNA-binding MarR family transcriptional regulator